MMSGIFQQITVTGIHQITKLLLTCSRICLTISAMKCSHKVGNPVYQDVGTDTENKIFTVGDVKFKAFFLVANYLHSAMLFHKFASKC